MPDSHFKGDFRGEKNPNGDMKIASGQEAVSVNDKEIFLRKAFDTDPQKGCELLFKQYYQPLCNHAVRYVYSREIAQDIVSDIFHFFLHKQLHLQVKTSFRAYLFIAVRNRSLKYLRDEFGKTDKSVDIGELDHSSAWPSPQQIMQFNELNFTINKSIQDMAPQCQRVFLLNRFEGKKYAEIAGELNISIKTVEAHISKALDLLRKAVRNEFIFLFFSILFF